MGSTAATIMVFPDKAGSTATITAHWPKACRTAGRVNFTRSRAGVQVTKVCLVGGGVLTKAKEGSKRGLADEERPIEQELGCPENRC
jgi:hypothetical protein